MTHARPALPALGRTGRRQLQIFTGRLFWAALFQAALMHHWVKKHRMKRPFRHLEL